MLRSPRSLVLSPVDPTWSGSGRCGRSAVSLRSADTGPVGLHAAGVPEDLVAQVDQVLAVDHHRGNRPADPCVPQPVNALPCLPAGKLTREPGCAVDAIHE